MIYLQKIDYVRKVWIGGFPLQSKLTSWGWVERRRSQGRLVLTSTPVLVLCHKQILQSRQNCHIGKTPYNLWLIFLVIYESLFIGHMSSRKSNRSWYRRELSRASLQLHVSPSNWVWSIFWERGLRGVWFSLCPMRNYLTHTDAKLIQISWRNLL